MTFKEAFEAMKHGAKVKLPGWNGYWCWDDDKKTIMIHCRPKDSDKGQGEVLDIRETQRVEYTFMHTQRDDWHPLMERRISPFSLCAVRLPPVPRR